MLRITRTSAVRGIRFANTAAYDASVQLLKADLKQAMLKKNNTAKNAIRNLLSTIKNSEIDNKKDNDEFILYDIFAKLISQRKDSVEQFKQANRADLAETEIAEIAIIEKYINALPVAGAEEIDAKVKEFLTTVKEKEGSLPISKIFPKLDWKIIPTEWKASPSAIKASIVRQHKEIF